VKSATDLLRLHHELIASYQMDRWYLLFAEDAVVELPYSSTGWRRLEGKAAIIDHFRMTPEVFLDMELHDFRVVVAGEETAIAEVHGSATIAPTGLRYEQDWVMVLHAKGGKIVHYREYGNPLAVAKAFGRTIESVLAAYP
jgi:ketosteroid isomerase-like protein